MRDIKAFTATLLAGAGAVLFASQLYAAEAALSPLIRYVRQSESSLLGTMTKADSFIFRDGLVIERLNADEVMCGIVRGESSASKLAELEAALARHRVGFQEGGCQIKEPIDNFVVEARVTWFGKGNRQNTYTTTNVAPEPCPAGAVEIDRAIQSLLAAAQGEVVPIACP